MDQFQMGTEWDIVQVCTNSGGFVTWVPQISQKSSKINSVRIETHGDDWGSAILSTPLSAIYEILSLPTIIPSWAGPARRPGHLPRLHEACSARTNANVQLPCRWGRRNSAKNSLNTSLKFRI